MQGVKSVLCDASNQNGSYSALLPLVPLLERDALQQLVNNTSHPRFIELCSEAALGDALVSVLRLMKYP